MKVLLKGVVGSTAYGLNHEGSDVDYLGVFAAPNREILGLGKVQESVNTKDPDTTMHEAKKFVQLCLNGNPSVSEVLWLDAYEQIDEFGAELVRIRHSFLSSRKVRDSYLGYAASQFSRLKNRGDGSFSADTRKRTGVSSGTLAHHEDMQLMREEEERYRVRGESQEFGRTGGSLQGLHPREASGGIRPESGAVSRGISQAKEAEQNRHPGEASPSASEADVRHHAGGSGGAARAAGGRVPDLRFSCGSGGPLSRNGPSEGTSLSEVQPGAGALRGQRNSPESRLEVSGDEQRDLSPERRKRARLEKHARHLVRLVEQGYHLYRSGELVVNLRSSASEMTPERVFELGRSIAQDPEHGEKYMRLAEVRFDQVRSPLPERPDTAMVENWLLWVRRRNWSWA